MKLLKSIRKGASAIEIVAIAGLSASVLLGGLLGYFGALDSSSQKACDKYADKFLNYVSNVKYTGFKNPVLGSKGQYISRGTNFFEGKEQQWSNLNGHNNAVYELASSKANDGEYVLNIEDDGIHIEGLTYSEQPTTISKTLKLVDEMYSFARSEVTYYYLINIFNYTNINDAKLSTYEQLFIDSTCISKDNDNNVLLHSTYYLAANGRNTKISYVNLKQYTNSQDA